MAEIQQQENQLNGVGVGVPLVISTSETVGSKRQRRPSVRLGDIGDQPYDSHVRRISTKPWKHQHQHQHHHHHHNNNHHNQNQINNNNNATVATSKPSKTKPLTNLTTTSVDETLDEDKDVNNNLDTVAIGSWRVKDSKKRGLAAKRVRSNWVSKIDEITASAGNNGDKEDKFSAGEDIDIDIDIDNDDSYNHHHQHHDDGGDDFDIENSESPLKEQSPIHSADRNEYRRSIRGSHHDGVVELSGPSDNDGGGGGGEDGVRIWLNSLGLGRYAPVFEIHEVDDEVLPMLTLEDLKDMGINAVGSRRKMFCAIQKLGKGFS